MDIHSQKCKVTTYTDQRTQQSKSRWSSPCPACVNMSHMLLCIGMSGPWWQLIPMIKNSGFWCIPVWAARRGFPETTGLWVQWELMNYVYHFYVICALFLKPNLSNFVFISYVYLYNVLHFILNKSIHPIPTCSNKSVQYLYVQVWFTWAEGGGWGKRVNEVMRSGIKQAGHKEERGEEWQGNGMGR